jgi:hypothetical protein
LFKGIRGQLDKHLNRPLLLFVNLSPENLQANIAIAVRILVGDDALLLAALLAVAVLFLPAPKDAPANAALD